MPTLTVPVPVMRVSFLAAMAEFQAEGRGAEDDESMIGTEFRDHGGTWSSPAGFAAYVRELRGQPLEDWPRPPALVPCTTLWWVEGAEYLGRIAVRHRLTSRLREWGGHVGYDVRPSARRRGHATAMLREVLPVAAGLGIDPALLTCAAGNTASRRVIERNRGVPAGRRGDKLRFWVPNTVR